MEMNAHITANSATSMSKRIVLYFGIAIIAIILIGTGIICSSVYEHKKAAILNSHKITLESWVNGTANSIVNWKSSINDQAKRISSSELYRLFAQDINDAGTEVATQLNTPGTTADPLDKDLAQYVEQVPLMRNLLFDFMNYSGFVDARIVNATGHTLLSAHTRSTPISPAQQQLVAESLKTGEALLGAVRPSTAGLVVDFVAPLHSAMGKDTKKYVAGLMLSKLITSDLAQFLARDRQQEGKFSPHLIQNEQGKWFDVVVHQPKPLPIEAGASPDSGSTQLPFGQRASLSDKELVFSYGVALPQMPWWLVLETPSSLVQEQLSALAWTTFGFGFLISLGIVLSLTLLWGLFMGREQKTVTRRFQNLYTLVEQQKSLLQCVNISLQVGLVLIEDSGKIHMVNRSFADLVLANEDTILQSKLDDLFEKPVAWQLIDSMREVMQSNTSKTFEVPLDNGSKLVRVTLYPFIDEQSETAMRGAVATFQDITEFRRTSERNKRQQAHMIEALVRAIEGVDPYLSGHSRKMGTLSMLIGQHLHLSEQDLATIHNAAEFSQMGKLFVPREILTKTDKLTDDELAELKKVPDYAYEVLRGIDFGLPVPQAVYQMYERPDGNGYPMRLAGEAIMIHARILAVTNAFCAMVSPRSYRGAMMSLTEAVTQLKNEPHNFDTQVVEALSFVILQPEASSLFTPPKIV